MGTLSSANVTDINLVLKECNHMRLCLNMLIFTHNLGNWLITLLYFSIVQVLCFSHAVHIHKLASYGFQAKQ